MTRDGALKILTDLVNGNEEKVINMIDDAKNAVKAMHHKYSVPIPTAAVMLYMESYRDYLNHSLKEDGRRFIGTIATMASIVVASIDLQAAEEIDDLLNNIKSNGDE